MLNPRFPRAVVSFSSLLRFRRNKMFTFSCYGGRGFVGSMECVQKHFRVDFDSTSSSASRGERDGTCARVASTSKGNWRFGTERQFAIQVVGR